MKAVINTFTKEIEIISYHAEFAQNNINVAGNLIAGADRYEIFDVSETNVPNDFKPFKYRLINGNFRTNAGYREDNTEAEISALKATIAEQNEKIHKQEQVQEEKLAEQDAVINDLLVSILMF